MTLGMDRYEITYNETHEIGSRRNIHHKSRNCAWETNSFTAKAAARVSAIPSPITIQACTQPGDERSEYGWKPAETLTPAFARPQPTEVVTLDDHIAAARALGPAEPAIDRFLEIIKRRRHLPVRIVDDAIRVLHLIQIVRLEMNDLQFCTLSGRSTPRVNCWQGQSNHFDGTKQSEVHQ